MRIGIIVSTNDAETCWNAFRFANFALNNKPALPTASPRGESAGRDEVNIFLIGKGVEYEQTSNDQFNIIEQAEEFLEAKGRMFACGTCLKQRNSAGSNLCPISTMKDMYRIVAESDKILTF